jgi:ClpP class serine protease
LVDKLGGLRDAIKEAKALAKLERIELIQVPALHSGRDNLLQKLLSDGEEDSPIFAKASVDPAKEFLKANAKWLRAIRAFNDPKGVYLTCPVLPDRRW